jgi:hypothetical protein
VAPFPDDGPEVSTEEAIYVTGIRNGMTIHAAHPHDGYPMRPWCGVRLNPYYERLGHITNGAVTCKRCRRIVAKFYEMPE